MKKDILTEILFLRKKTRITNGYDLYCEIGNIEAFIDEFQNKKTKEVKDENKELKNKNKEFEEKLEKLEKEKEAGIKKLKDENKKLKKKIKNSTTNLTNNFKKLIM